MWYNKDGGSMKKLFILFITIILLTGCGHKEENNNIEEKDNFVLEKIDNNKDYVYLEDYKILRYRDNKEYKLQNIIVNIKGEVIDNVNLELKNNMLNTFNNLNIKDNVINYGKVIDYEYNVTDEYISIVLDNSFYMNNNYDYIDSNVYVISLEKGIILDNNDILNEFQYNEDRIKKYLEEHIDSDDKDFVIMQIMNEGYKLYINEDNKMVIIYNELLNDSSIKKELVIE